MTHVQVYRSTYCLKYLTLNGAGEFPAIPSGTPTGTVRGGEFEVNEASKIKPGGQMGLISGEQQEMRAV